MARIPREMVETVRIVHVTLGLKFFKFFFPIIRNIISNQKKNKKFNFFEKKIKIMAGLEAAFQVPMPGDSGSSGTPAVFQTT